MQRHWHELWFAMADGDTTRYRELKSIEVIEFWDLFDRWKQGQDNMNEQLRSMKKKK